MISVEAFEGKRGHYFPSDTSDGADSDLQRLLDLKLVVRLDASGSLNEDGECCQVTKSGLAQFTMGQRYVNPISIFQYESNPPPPAAKMTAIDLLVSLRKAGWKEMYVNAGQRRGCEPYTKDSPKMAFYHKSLSIQYLKCLLELGAGEFVQLGGMIHHFQSNAYYRALLGLPTQQALKLVANQPAKAYKKLQKEHEHGPLAESSPMSRLMLQDGLDDEGAFNMVITQQQPHMLERGRQRGQGRGRSRGRGLARTRTSKSISDMSAAKINPDCDDCENIICVDDVSVAVQHGANSDLLEEDKGKGSDYSPSIAPLDEEDADPFSLQLQQQQPGTNREQPVAVAVAVAGAAAGAVSPSTAPLDEEEADPFSLQLQQRQQPGANREQPEPVAVAGAAAGAVSPSTAPLDEEEADPFSLQLQQQQPGANREQPEPVAVAGAAQGAALESEYPDDMLLVDLLVAAGESGGGGSGSRDLPLKSESESGVRDSQSE